MDDLTQLGPYKIESLLGEGGMASVYRVWHTDLHRREALKLLPPHMAHDRSFVERFLGQARTAARLHHRSIATIHTVSSAEAPQPYFTMELIEGGDLADFISSRGRLRVGEASALLFQMAGALDYAHQQGVIHRDVKPANVLLDKSGTDIVPKLVDFGIARAQEEAGGSRLTRTGMIVGTPEYMSPEQAGSGSVVDGRTDQYALAILAYEMLCGSPPFRAEEGSTAISVIMRHLQETPRSISSLTSDVPESVSRAVLKALSKKPEDRYSSCTEFVQAIIHAAEDTRAVVPQAAAVSIPKVAAPQPGMPPQSRAASKVAAAATVMLALAGLAMIVMAVNRSHGAPKQSDTPTAVDGVSAEKPGQGNGEKSVHESGEIPVQEKKQDSQVVTPHSQPPPVVNEEVEQRNEIRNRYQDWLNAWQSRDVNKYMSFYASGATRRDDNKVWRDRATFQRGMGSKWSQLTYIRIESATPDITIENGTGVLVAQQHYDSNTWWDKGSKHLVWQKENGEWMIVRESFDRSSGGHKSSSGTGPSTPAPSSTALDYPEVSERVLTNADLDRHSDWELTIMRNSIYAKYGLIFKKPDLRNYFTGKSWYVGRSSDPTEVHSHFSKTEDSNASLILSYQKAHGNSRNLHGN